MLVLLGLIVEVICTGKISSNRIKQVICSKRGIKYFGLKYSWLRISEVSIKLALAKQGFSVLLLKKGRLIPFTIGESMLHKPLLVLVIRSSFIFSK